MTKMGPIGILPSHRPSYIDHLVPLCELFQAPLLVTSSEIAHIIQLYYPQVNVILVEPEDHCLDPFLEPYDFFFYVDLFRLATKSFSFADYYCSVKRPSLCALHGHSEKAWEIFRFERFVDEEHLLIYGPQWKNFLQEIGVWDRLNTPLMGGNYRWLYYLRHQKFFDEKWAPFLNHVGKKVLFAPTWTSDNKKSELREDYSTALQTLPRLVDSLPNQTHLYVKLHPHYRFLYPERVSDLEKKFAYHPQVHFLPEIPLIYPLLAKIDVYIGDYSSIGYDFLRFKRPLFFLVPERKKRLFSCGTVIDPNEVERVFQVEPGSGNLSASESVYKNAFGVKQLSWQELERKLNHVYRSSCKRK